MSKFSKTDGLFRQIILQERPEVCEKCLNHRPVGVAHILPKGSHPRLRYQRTNVLLMCWHCHLEWAHKNPLEFNEWVCQYKGATLLDDLRIIERQLPKVDLKMLNLCFAEELSHAKEKEEVPEVWL